ncbi:16S rRNA (guanine(1207)-N(2))-methyltransferase [hydrothermal vent metagenome]|uniref:16S rRNA (Guanine(1207)-N(2))-methyltransferase n=1 Tax=hydrothermal vent metagenome TaxID=652676 RepID=A0A3B0VJ41_9ZZZZ
MKESYFKKVLSFKYQDKTVQFRVAQELFSSHDVDGGSRFLLRTLGQRPLKAVKRVLDMGCGYGTLGLTLKAVDKQRTVHLVDRDGLAVDFAQQNVALNELDNVSVYGSLGYDDLRGGQFDLIVSNIPGKAGEAVITHLIQDARPFLAKNGRVAVVVVTPLVPLVEKLLERMPDTAVSLKESSANHTVFHYHFTAEPPASSPQNSFATGLYWRDIMSVSSRKLAFEMQTAFGLPEFDTLSYQTRLLFNILNGLPASPVNHLLVINPGQGHTAVAAWHRLQPQQISLVDRDLLALQTTAHNLQQNGCPAEIISSYHQIGLPPLPTPADLVIHPLRDSEGPKIAVARLNLLAEQLAPKAFAFIGANSHLISQVEQQMKRNGRLKPRQRKRRKGFSTLSLTPK